MVCYAYTQNFSPDRLALRYVLGSGGDNDDDNDDDDDGDGPGCAISTLSLHSIDVPTSCPEAYLIAAPS